MGDFVSAVDETVAVAKEHEFEGHRKDGSRFPVELTVTEFLLSGDQHFTGVVRDLTSRKRLETQLLHIQKMDAVGRLASGVAHDFNNLLTVINGYADLLLADMESNDLDRNAVSAILDAGTRAASVTSQLLAFSRRTVIAPVVLDLNEIVAQSHQLLRRLISENIDVKVMADSHCFVYVDANQIGQVIMNLVLNARDAMPNGGQICLKTQRICSANGGQSGLPGSSGNRNFIQLSVSDDGVGIPEEIRSKLFEPFFTTKEVGKGTGLGLATAYGIIQQAGGHLEVESQVGRGTVVRVLLPAAEQPETSWKADRVAGEQDQNAGKGDERILLVEDDDSVRRITTVVLQSFGYTVVTASNGPEAIDLLQQDLQPDILITDVVMPEMSGRELADKVRIIAPKIRVLYCSGYTDDAVLLHGVRVATDAYIQKPYTPVGLAKKVRAVIDGVG